MGFFRKVGKKYSTGRVFAVPDAEDPQLWSTRSRGRAKDVGGSPSGMALSLWSEERGLHTARMPAATDCLQQRWIHHACTGTCVADEDLGECAERRSVDARYRKKREILA